MSATTVDEKPAAAGSKKPAKSATEQIADRLAELTAQNRAFYRECVAAEAKGEGLPGKGVERLADAMTALGLTAETFKADVDAYRNWTSWQTTLAKLPPAEELRDRRKALMARSKAIGEEIKKLQQEQRDLLNQIQYTPDPRANAEQQADTLVRGNPRVFGAWPEPSKPRDVVGFSAYVDGGAAHTQG